MEQGTEEARQPTVPVAYYCSLTDKCCRPFRQVLARVCRQVVGGTGVVLKWNAKEQKTVALNTPTGAADGAGGHQRAAADTRRQGAGAGVQGAHMKCWAHVCEWSRGSYLQSYDVSASPFGPRVRLVWCSSVQQNTGQSAPVRPCQPGGVAGAGCAEGAQRACERAPQDHRGLRARQEGARRAMVPLS